MNIIIIYEDEDILVIDKPAGMTVNRAESTRERTVQDWSEPRLNLKPTNLAGRQGKKYIPTSPAGREKRIEGEKWDPVTDYYNRGGIVHRLDKETSGILVLAKNPESFVDLQRQFKERVVEKTYIALVHGKLVPGNGVISVPVGRLPWNRMQFGVVPGGRESVTNYKVLEYYSFPKYSGGDLYSYLELFPKTGRTHQIRVHLKYIGHPIFADFLYAGRKSARKDREILGRVFLHAAKLSLAHPKTGEKVTFESPLRQELLSVLDLLEKVELKI